MQITFDCDGHTAIVEATLWDKVEGKERVYLRSGASGKDLGFYDINADKLCGALTSGKWKEDYLQNVLNALRASFKPVAVTASTASADDELIKTETREVWVGGDEPEQMITFRTYRRADGTTYTQESAHH